LLPKLAIANRLLGVIAKVTHSDQTCGGPDWNSLESVRLLKDVVFHANQNRKAAAIRWTRRRRLIG
jgi:hypothetical protein